MASFPLTIIQTFSVTRSITVEREGTHWLDAVTRQEADCAPDFDDPAWQTDWDLVEEEVEPINPPENWDEVDGDDPDAED